MALLVGELAFFPPFNVQYLPNPNCLAPRFNPRMSAISRELPESLLNAPSHLRCEWRTSSDDKGVYHIHTYTREYVRRMLQQEINTK
jgi:hypothetical protein